MEYDSEEPYCLNDSDNPNYKHISLKEIKQIDSNEYSLNNKPKSKKIISDKEKYKKSEAGINEDNAMEIINVEFEELKEWIKFKMRYLKRECTDVIESIKLQKEENNEYN